MALVSRSFRSIGWLLGALWLALAPLGVFWARLCVCGEASRVLCCAHPATTLPDPAALPRASAHVVSVQAVVRTTAAGANCNRQTTSWARLNLGAGLETAHLGHRPALAFCLSRC
jgi:hypothetical protein